MTTVQTQQRQTALNRHTTDAPPTQDTKWKWDRTQQDARNAVVLSPYFIGIADDAVHRQQAGTSITTALRQTLAEVKNVVANRNANAADDDEIDSFLAMTRTNQRLVVRKILHNGYRNGNYTLVEADSTYRTGKKSKTKNYVLVVR